MLLLVGVVAVLALSVVAQIDARRRRRGPARILAFRPRDEPIASEA
jgi:hypothetical protein